MPIIFHTECFYQLAYRKFFAAASHWLHDQQCSADMSSSAFHLCFSLRTAVRFEVESPNSPAAFASVASTIH